MRMRSLIIAVASAPVLLLSGLPSGSRGAKATCAEDAIHRYQKCLAAARSWLDRVHCDAQFTEEYNRCLVLE